MEFDKLTTEQVNTESLNLDLLTPYEAAQLMNRIDHQAVEAVNAALKVLKEDGVMTVCVYPGHEEGARERDALLDWSRALDERAYAVMLRAYLNQSGDPPLMIAIKKNRKRKRA